MQQWDWEGNQGIDPYRVGCYSHQRVSWRCAEHGLWDAMVYSRVNNKTGCPECARQQRFGQGPQRRGLLKDEMPEVYAELHPTKNAGVDTEKLTCGCKKRLWWLCQSPHSRPAGCQHDHEWEAYVYSRCSPKAPTRCPFCTGKLVCPCKSLAELQPALLQYWDVAANAVPLATPIDPLWLGVYSTRKVWWRHECDDGQVCRWAATVTNVSRRFIASGRVPCPSCGAADRNANNQRRKKRINRN